MKKKATQEQWMALYEQAVKIKKQKPWRWINEGQIFAIEDPKTKINYYCVVRADDLADTLTFLIGAEGFNRFIGGINALEHEELEYNEMSLADYLMTFDELSLTCTFVDKDRLILEERERMQKIGMTFRGRKQWISLRKMTPGQLVDAVQDAAQVETMTTLLEQARKVFSLEKQQNFLTDIYNNQIMQDIYLWQSDPKTKRWAGSFIKLEEVINLFPICTYNNQLDMHKVRRLKNSRKLYELLRIYMPIPVEHQGDFCFPIVFMLMDLDTGEIAWSHMDTVNDGYELRFLDQMAQFFLDEGRKPAKIVTADFVLHHIVADFCSKTRVFLDFLDYTVVGNEVIENFLQYAKTSMKMTPEQFFEEEFMNEDPEEDDFEFEGLFGREFSGAQRRHKKQQPETENKVSNIIDFRTGKPIDMPPEDDQ